MKTQRINVYGMSCEHCVKSVTKAISGLKGVNQVNVNLKDKYADVTFDEKLTGPDDFKKAVRDAGYATEEEGDGEDGEDDRIDSKNSTPDKNTSINAETPFSRDADIVKKSVHLKFKIGKMDCASCAETIVDSVKRVPGVIDAKLNFVNETLYAEGSPDYTDLPSEIIKMVEFAGFTAKQHPDIEIKPRPEETASSEPMPSLQENGLKTARFKISGMHCTNCARTIEKAVGKLKGVDSISVNFAGESGLVVFDRAVISLSGIFDAVKKSGYTPIGEPDDLTPVITQKPEEPTFHVRWLYNLDKWLYKRFYGIEEWKKDLYWVIFTFILAVPVAALSYGNMFAASSSIALFSTGVFTVLILFILATIAQFTSGLTFYKGAYYSLRNFGANMDVLVSLGISAAYFYSVAAIFFFKGELYFDTSVLLILFIRTGKLLEKLSKERAASSLKSLFKLQADTANLIMPDGTVKNIETEVIKEGNILLVKKGDKIPADGIIEEGETLIDESMLTGEPVPVERKKGDEVKSATINSGNIIKIKALRVGKDTVLSQIVRMVEDAQADKAPIQRIADRVTNYFVPVVVFISLLSFTLWKFVFHSSFLFALSAAIAVLVIACPCAMGLATPMALMVGSAIGLEKGILVKKSSCLEESARINAVVFDKTGTITYGKPEVSDILPLSVYGRNELLKIAFISEQFSSHPIAGAIINEYNNKKSDPDYKSEKEKSGISETDKPSGFEEIGGFGLSLALQGKHILIGKRGLFEKETGIKGFEGFADLEEKFVKEGKTVIGIAIDSEMSGALILSDKIKEEAPEVIKKLKRMNITPFLLTGDNLNAAKSVAEALGIGDENIIANVLPDEKLNEIKKLKEKGLHVAMVGDGINDAPALAMADVGIAIGSGTDVARETGDIVLVKNDLRDSYRTIALGKKTLNKVKQNLFWAFIFNGIGIPFAAGLFYRFTGFLIPPAAAGAAMAVSSITVSLNSVLLKGFSGKLSRL